MTGAPGLGRTYRRRKFSELYRRTTLYHERRVWKAARNLRRAIIDEAARLVFWLLTRLPRVKRSEFPFECHLCGLKITSVDDRIEWHGLGNCVEICDDCLGTGLDESQPDPEAANLKCPMCGGRGWFHFIQLDTGQRGVIVTGEKPSDLLRFPDRPIIPTKDAKFDGRIET